MQDRPSTCSGLAGDAGSSCYWSGLAKERTGRAAGDTASVTILR